MKCANSSNRIRVKNIRTGVFTSGDFSVWIGTVSSYSFPNILYVSSWKREEEVHNPTSTSYSFPTSGTFLVGKGRKRYTALQTLGTLGILGTLCILRKHLEHFVYFENTWNAWHTSKTLGILRTHLENTWHTSNTLGTLGTHFEHFEHTWYTSNTLGTLGILRTHFEHLENTRGLERRFLVGGRKRYTAIQTLRKARKERAKRESFWIGTAPLYYFSLVGNLGVPNQFLFSIPACGNTNGSKRRKCKIENKTNLERKHYA